MRDDLDLSLRPVPGLAVAIAAPSAAAFFWAGACPGLCPTLRAVIGASALWLARASVVAYLRGRPPYVRRLIVTGASRVYAGFAEGPLSAARAEAGTRVFPALTLVRLAFADGTRAVAVVAPGSCPARTHARLRARLRLDAELLRR